MTTSMASSASNCTSIVDLFKSAKPRTKLFIQLIPPGYTEDEFKELIRPFAEQIDYFVFRPGRIIRDSYGHLIGLDCPNYGFATVNFKNPKFCPKFFREFNQLSLSDSYNIKSKLLVEFALMQEVPDFSVGANASNLLEFSGSFRDLPIYKEFLKTFPFAAKAEEERRSSLGPVKIDLEDDAVVPGELELPDKSNDLDRKLSVPASPTEAPVTFATLMASLKNGSLEAVTPLTEFVKKSGINDRLPPAKIEGKKSRRRRGKGSKSEQAVNPENKESTESNAVKKDNKTKKEERKKRSRERKKKEAEANQQQKLIESEKKSFRTSSAASSIPVDSKNKKDKNDKKEKKKDKKESLVENAPQATQIKGVPKILLRKPANTNTNSSDNNGTTVSTSVNSNSNTSAQVDYVAQKLQNLLNPIDDESDALLEKAIQNFSVNDLEAQESTKNTKRRNRNRKSKAEHDQDHEKGKEIEKEKEKGTLKTKPARAPYIRPEDRTKSSPIPLPKPVKSEPVNETADQKTSKKIVVKTKQSKHELKKVDQPPVTSVTSVPAPVIAPVKKAFTSGSKK